MIKQKHLARCDNLALLCVCVSEEQHPKAMVKNKIYNLNDMHCHHDIFLRVRRIGHDGMHCNSSDQSNPRTITTLGRRERCRAVLSVHNVQR